MTVNIYTSGDIDKVIDALSKVSGNKFVQDDEPHAYRCKEEITLDHVREASNMISDTSVVVHFRTANEEFALKAMNGAGYRDDREPWDPIHKCFVKGWRLHLADDNEYTVVDKWGKVTHIHGKDTKEAIRRYHSYDPNPGKLTVFTGHISPETIP